jgi:acyl carrier protein
LNKSVLLSTITPLFVTSLLLSPGILGTLHTVDEAQIYERLMQIFQDIFSDHLISVTPELSAKDVDGWDSLTHIRLMLTVEKAFKIKFSTSEIGSLKNVGELVTLIKTRT